MKKYGSWTEQESSKFRANGFQITLQPDGALSADRTISLPNGSTYLIGRTSVDQTTNRLQNKDLSDDNIKFVNSSDTSKAARFDLSGITAAATRVITLPDSNLTVVGTATAQTLTNKTIDGDDNTIQDLALTSLKTTANLDVFLQRNGSGVVIDSAKAVPSGVVVGTTDTQTLTNKTLTAPDMTLPRIQDSDASHYYTINPNNIAGNVNINLPALTVSDELIFANFTATLTNKTLTSAVLTTPRINDLTSTNTYIFAAQELTADRTVTLPLLTGNDTFVFQSHTQPLSNKTLSNTTINAAANTITNITNAEISASAAISLSKLDTVTPSRALASDGSGIITASSVTSTELGYVSGVTSSIQTQIDSKQADVITTEGDVIIGNVSGDASRLGIGANGTVLTSNGTTATWSTPAGTGDVTSSANIGDNRIVRGDGGAKGVQQSGITIDDSDNLTNVNTINFDYATALTLLNKESAVILNNSNITGGDNTYGIAIGWTNHAGAGVRSGMASVQTDTDNDIQGLAFFTHSSATGADASIEAMRIEGNGYVGVNTTAPSGLVHLRHDGTLTKQTLVIDSADTSFVLDDQVSGITFMCRDASFGPTDDIGAMVQMVSDSSTGGSMRLELSAGGSTAASGVNPLRVLNDGTVRMGNNVTSSVVGKFEVRDSSNVPQVLVDTTGTGNLFEGRVSATQKMRVENDGDLFNTNGTYGTISDQNLKENIIDATNKLAELNQLRVVNFNFIGDDKKQLGFIAQEVEQVFPNLVKTPEVGEEEVAYKTIKTSILIPMLVKAIQELTARVIELENA